MTNELTYMPLYDMSKTLHILNGDSTFHIFKGTGLTGDVLVWREMLSEGPVSAQNLWETRSKWINEVYNEALIGYQEKVLNTVQKLKELDQYEELVLWFEYDLFCQINLIGILNILNQNTQLPNIYLICPAEIEGMPDFRGLGELNSSQLLDLWPTRVKLNKSDLEFASEAWDLYVANNPIAIETFLNRDFGQLPLLKNALRAHLLRFPKAPKQLNHIEETLLQIINSGIRSKPAIYQAFWSKEPIYGMGDLQIDHVLDQLQAKGEIAKDFIS